MAKLRIDKGLGARIRNTGSGLSAVSGPARCWQQNRPIYSGNDGAFVVRRFAVAACVAAAVLAAAAVPLLVGLNWDEGTPPGPEVARTTILLVRFTWPRGQARRRAPLPRRGGGSPAAAGPA